MYLIPRKVPYRPWPVTVIYQDCDDAGQVSEIKQTFVAHFLPFTEEELEELIAEAKAKHPAESKNKQPATDEVSASCAITLRRNAHVFNALIVGWGKEVRDEQKNSIPFSAELLRSWVTGSDGMAISTGINVALGQIRFGHAPEKNSSTSPAPGQKPIAGEVATEVVAVPPVETVTTS